MSPRYTEDAAREYSESLGMIGAGAWRQVAWAERQGIPTALGMTTREWVVAFVGGWVRLPIDDRRAAAIELTTGPEALSQRAVADVLGVSDETIRRDISATNVALDPPFEREDATNVAVTSYVNEVPIDDEPWLALKGVFDSIGVLGKSYDAARIAAAVPARRRAATAKRLRSSGTDLGRVALALERMESSL